MSLHNLPEAEIVLLGLSDLQNGQSNTIEALLVAIAATRLTKAGLDVFKISSSHRTRANTKSRN